MEEHIKKVSKQNIYELVSQCSDVIRDAISKADEIINDEKYKTVLVSISGGSDSDDILDICWHIDRDNKCKYIWFDTGLEYQATKDHLKYLEEKYNITIIKEKAIKPIPCSCIEHGLPFISKYVSKNICTLQERGFDFSDKSYDELTNQYPHTREALKWWCNFGTKIGRKNLYDINRNRYLKEFLIQNPPPFKISHKCCEYAKKKTGSMANLKYNADILIIGLRKSEGGARSLNPNYKTCFSNGKDIATFRPIWWWRDDDKKEYEIATGIKHSDCYETWGFKRTGCTGCPFNMQIKKDLEKVKQYEPQLYKAACNVFGDSYEYTERFNDFKREMKEKGIKPRKD